MNWQPLYWKLYHLSPAGNCIYLGFAQHRAGAHICLTPTSALPPFPSAPLICSTASLQLSLFGNICKASWHCVELVRVAIPLVHFSSKSKRPTWTPVIRPWGSNVEALTLPIPHWCGAVNTRAHMVGGWIIKVGTQAVAVQMM